MGMNIEELIETLIEAIQDNTIELRKANGGNTSDFKMMTNHPADDEEQLSDHEGDDDEEETPPTKKPTATKKAAPKKKASRKKSDKKNNSKSDPDELKKYHSDTKELLQAYTKKLSEEGAETPALAKVAVIDFMEEETGVRRLDAITFAQFPAFIEALQEEVND